MPTKAIISLLISASLTTIATIANASSAKSQEINSNLQANTTADDYVNWGNAYYNQNQYDKAIDEFNQAIKIDPKNAHAYLGRGNAYK